jgi:hypothetical protein
MAADTVQIVSKNDAGGPVNSASIPTPVVDIVYTAKLEKRAVKYVANSEVYSGAGIYEEWSVSILERGKPYLKNVGIVARLNEQNTVPQNDHINEELVTDPNIAEDALLIIQHDVSVTKPVVPLPKKVQWILSKLNA